MALYVFAGSTIALIITREILRLIRHELYRYGHGVSRVLIYRQFRRDNRHYYVVK